MAPYEIVVVDFAQKADALTVFAVGIGHAGADGYLSDIFFRHAAYGKHQMGELVIGDTCKEIGLVFDRVDRSR